MLPDQGHGHAFRRSDSQPGVTLIRTTASGKPALVAGSFAASSGYHIPRPRIRRHGRTVPMRAPRCPTRSGWNFALPSRAGGGGETKKSDANNSEAPMASLAFQEPFHVPRRVDDVEDLDSVRNRAVENQVIVEVLDAE